MKRNTKRYIKTPELAQEVADNIQPWVLIVARIIGIAPETLARAIIENRATALFINTRILIKAINASRKTKKKKRKTACLTWGIVRIARVFQDLSLYRVNIAIALNEMLVGMGIKG